MRNLFLAGAASLALICGAAPLIAQDAPAAAATTLTAEQKAAYDVWPAEQKAGYDAWPAAYQAYYWSLSGNQQNGWLRLTAEQRAQIMTMDAAQRTAAWVSIEGQLKAEAPPAPDGTAQVQANPRGEGPASATPPNPQTANSAVPPAQPADPAYHGGPYKGALTKAPAEAMNKTYPVCSRTVQDSCRNRGGK